jgi:hypothetical protein
MKTTRTHLTLGLAIVSFALVGWLVMRSYAAAQTQAGKPAADEELQQLLTERFESATKALQIERLKLDSGKSSHEMMYQAARRLLEAELELDATPAGRVAALNKHVTLMRQFEREAAKKVEIGVLPVGDAETPRYWRLTAEVELVRAKRAAAQK